MVGRQVPLIQAHGPWAFLVLRASANRRSRRSKNGRQMPAVFHSLQRAILSGMISRSSAVGHGGGSRK